METKQTEFDFEKVQAGNVEESFLKFMAEKYQESYDSSMRGLLENDGYLSNDEIELIIENQPKNDKETLTEQLQKMAQNKFENLEKLAFYPAFIDSIPLLAEGLHTFTEGVKQAQDKRIGSEEIQENNTVRNSNSLNINHLKTFFKNAPIAKKDLDKLIQTHHQYPQRLILAVEEQFFPHILLPNEQEKAIETGVKDYIKTMSQIVQSGALLMDKSQRLYTQMDKVNILQKPLEQAIKADSVDDLSQKTNFKKQGITVYQDHHIMYALIKNFGKNFNQSFKNNSVKIPQKVSEQEDKEYQARKVAVKLFVKQLEKVVGKQEGVKQLKIQIDDIAVGKFSTEIKINDVESRFYLVKRDDKFFVSLLPSQAPKNQLEVSRKQSRHRIPKMSKMT
ncbi:MAG: hypothetical protein MUF58_13700 [Arcicella sp.]|jgi:hypothetical protein|nr:hypothetical protein [Arcicella sp.]